MRLHLHFGRARRLDQYRFGDSLGVEGTGDSICPRVRSVKILTPFSSRYIAITSVPFSSAPGRTIDPGGVRSLVPSVRVTSVPVSSTLCTRPTTIFLSPCVSASANAGAKPSTATRPASIHFFMNSPAPQDCCGDKLITIGRRGRRVNPEGPSCNAGLGRAQRSLGGGTGTPPPSVM